MDYARYIGIFLVVFGHSLQKFNWDECAFVKTLWDYIYLFHMPLFFIISGYLYESKAVNMTNIQFGGGKIVNTILFPYVLYQFAFFPLALYASHGFTETSVISKFLLGILSGDGYETSFSKYVCLPCWFIVCIIQIRLLFMLVPINKYTSSLLSCCCIALLVLCKQSNIDLYFCLDNTMMAIPYFLFGHYLRRIKYAGCKRNIILLIVAVVSIISIAVILNQNGPAQMIGPSYGKNIFVNYMAGFLGTLLVWAVSNIVANFYENKKFIRTISRNTLFIIFFHWLILSGCGFIIKKLLWNSCLSGMCIIISSLILSQIVLWISNKVIVYGVCRYPILFGKKYKKHI